MSGRVLLADEDASLRGQLADALDREGLAVDVTDDGQLALDRAATQHYDLVILDISVPGLGGLEGCRQIRFESDVPLLIASARDSAADRVLGLEAGADDYVGKPFSLAEMLSRVRALLRRRLLDTGPARSIRRVGDVEIDLWRHRVLLAGEEVRLTPMEFRLLALLAEQPGRAFTAREILQALWNTDYVGQPHACKAHISNLRQKLEDDRARPRRIVTVPGGGCALHA
jgi:DNA-binding response OmpR family regulator